MGLKCLWERRGSGAVGAPDTDTDTAAAGTAAMAGTAATAAFMAAMGAATDTAAATDITGNPCVENRR